MGFIALFGTAVQTGVVMVIYLEEAVARKQREMGGALTRSALRDAVVEGALLRLRPKVMTVSTVVAGLLPIMWSTRVGAEVMKPLATPVLGGMVSSLLHVLVVTPVIFFWLQERRLGLQHESLPPPATRSPLNWRPIVAILGLVILVTASIALWRSMRSTQVADVSTGQVVQTVRSGDIRIAVVSATGTLHQGRNAFTIEFRGANGQLVDVGAVRVSGNMPMPGMVMSGGLEVHRSTVAGRYDATADFGMAGAWHMAIEWDGPMGRGSINFEGTVQ